MIGQKTTKSVKIFPLEKFRLYGSVCAHVRMYVCVRACVHACVRACV